MKRTNIYRLFCTLLAILSFNLSFGQNEVVIKGTITDQETAESIPFANVVLKKSDGEFIAGATSDFDGNYAIKMPTELLKRDIEFVLQVTYIGYSEQSQAFKPKRAEEYVLNFRLKSDSHTGCCCIHPIYEPFFSDHSGETFDQEDIKTVYRQ